MRASHNGGLVSSTDRAPRALSAVFGNSDNSPHATSSAHSSAAAHKSGSASSCNQNGPPSTPRHRDHQENTPTDSGHGSNSGGVETTSTATADGARACLMTPMQSRRPSVASATVASSGVPQTITAAAAATTGMPRRPQPTDAPRKGHAPARRPFVGSVSTAGFASSDDRCTEEVPIEVNSDQLTKRLSTPSQHSFRTQGLTEPEARAPISFDNDGDGPSGAASASVTAAAVAPITTIPSGPSRPTDAPRKASRPTIGRLQFEASITNRAVVSSVIDTAGAAAAICAARDTAPEDAFDDSVTLQPSMLFSPRPPGADADPSPSTTAASLHRQRLLFSSSDESTEPSTAVALSNDDVSFTTDSIDSPRVTALPGPAVSTIASAQTEAQAIDLTDAPTLEMGQLMNGLCEPSTPYRGNVSPSSSSSSSSSLSPLRAASDEEGPARSLLASLHAATAAEESSTTEDRATAPVAAASADTASANTTSSLSSSPPSSSSASGVAVVERSRSHHSQGPRRRLFRNSSVAQANTSTNSNSNSSSSSSSSSMCNTSSDRIARNGPSGSGQRRSWPHHQPAASAAPVAAAASNTPSAAVAAAAGGVLARSNSKEENVDGEEARCAWEAQHSLSSPSSSSYSDNPYIISTVTTRTVAAPTASSNAAGAAAATADLAPTDACDSNDGGVALADSSTGGRLSSHRQPTAPASRQALPHHHQQQQQRQRRPVRPSFGGQRPMNNAIAPAPSATPAPATSSTCSTNGSDSITQQRQGIISDDASRSSDVSPSYEALAFEEAAERVRAQEVHALRMAAETTRPAKTATLTAAASPALSTAALALERTVTSASRNASRASSNASGASSNAPGASSNASAASTSHSLEFLPSIQPPSSAAGSVTEAFDEEARPEHDDDDDSESATSNNSGNDAEENDEAAAAAFEKRRAQQLEAMWQSNKMPEQRQRIVLQQRVRIAQRDSQNEALSLSNRAAARMATRAAAATAVFSSSSSAPASSLARLQAAPSPSTVAQAALFKAQWNAAQLSSPTSPLSSSTTSLSSHQDKDKPTAETATESARGVSLPPATSSTSPSSSSFASPTSPTAAAAAAATVAGAGLGAAGAGAGTAGFGPSSRTSLAATGQRGQGGGPYDVYASSPIRVAPQRRELLTASPSATLSSLIAATAEKNSSASSGIDQGSVKRNVRLITFSLEEEDNQVTSAARCDQQISSAQNYTPGASKDGCHSTAATADDETALVIAATPTTPQREEAHCSSVITASSDSSASANEGGALRITSGPRIGSPLLASPPPQHSAGKKRVEELKQAEMAAEMTVVSATPHKPLHSQMHAPQKENDGAKDSVNASFNTPLHIPHIAKTPIHRPSLRSCNNNNSSNNKSAQSDAPAAVAAAAATPTGVEGIDAALGLMSPVNMRYSATSSTAGAQARPNTRSKSKTSSMQSLSSAAVVATSPSSPSTLTSLKDLPPLPGLRSSSASGQEKQDTQPEQQRRHHHQEDSRTWNLCDRPGRSSNAFQTLLVENSTTSVSQGATKAEKQIITRTSGTQEVNFDALSKDNTGNNRSQSPNVNDGNAKMSPAATMDAAESQRMELPHDLNLGERCPQGGDPTESPPQLVRPSSSRQADADERRFAALRQSQRFSSFQEEFAQDSEDRENGSSMAEKAAVVVSRNSSTSAYAPGGSSSSGPNATSSRPRRAGRILRPASSNAPTNTSDNKEGGGFSTEMACDDASFQEKTRLVSGSIDLRGVVGHVP